MIVCTTADLTAEQKIKIADETQCEVVQKKISLLTKKEMDKVECLLTYGNFDDAVSAAELEGFPNLRWIHVLSSGTEQLPRPVIIEKDIHVTSSKGIHAIPISEYVIFCILYFAKRNPEFRQLQHQMKWSYTEGMFEVHGKTLGALGTGSIGCEVAKKAKALGMNVIGINRSGRHVAEFDQTYPIQQLSQVVRTCDYICNVLPSTKETIHLIDEKLIRLMKKQVIFINVGRGDAVVESDLIEALQMGVIGGAALDVFQDEPLRKGHPFWSMENVLVTPHASARTELCMNRAIELFIGNFQHYKTDRFENMLNKVTFNI